MESPILSVDRRCRSFLEINVAYLERCKARPGLFESVKGLFDVTFTNDATRWTRLYLFRSKDQTFQCYVSFCCLGLSNNVLLVTPMERGEGPQTIDVTLSSEYSQSKLHQYTGRSTLWVKLKKPCSELLPVLRAVVTSEDRRKEHRGGRVVETSK